MDVKHLLWTWYILSIVWLVASIFTDNLASGILAFINIWAIAYLT